MTSDRPAADLLDVEVLGGLSVVGKEGRAEPEFEGLRAGHVGRTVAASVELWAEVGRVDLVARDGRRREVDGTPVDAGVEVAAAEDIEYVVRTTDEGLDVDVASLVIEDPLALVTVKREGEEGVSAGLDGPLLVGGEREIHGVEFEG